MSIQEQIQVKPFTSVLDLPHGYPTYSFEVVVQRFWPKVEKTAGCWNWRKACKTAGYGYIAVKGKYLVAHRVSYEITKGRIAVGLTLDHLCRNRACVNPDHLEPVTLKENILRGNTIFAINKQKTHCLKGHPLSGDNLVSWYAKKGYRICSICFKASVKRYQTRLRKQNPNYFKEHSKRCHQNNRIRLGMLGLENWR